VAAEFFIRQPVEDGVEEAHDEQLPRGGGMYASGFKIEQLAVVDLRGGRTVGATDVIRLDFETGHAVGLGVVA
jgi:hypothetical protein